jgi:hypothetical protein
MDEGKHVGGVRHFSNVFVSPFGSVAKERGIPKWWGGLLMPLPWVPWGILNEPCFKDPIERGLLTWCRQIPSNFKSCPGSFLRENSDRAVVCRGKRNDLVGRGLDATVGRDFLEFYRVGFALGGLEHEIDLVEWGARIWSWIADPFSCLRVVDAFIWMPWDAGSDGVLASFV